MYLYVCLYVSMHMHVCTFHANTYIRQDMHRHIHAYMHTYIHTYILQTHRPSIHFHSCNLPLQQFTLPILTFDPRISSVGLPAVEAHLVPPQMQPFMLVRLLCMYGIVTLTHHVLATWLRDRLMLTYHVIMVTWCSRAFHKQPIYACKRVVYGCVDGVLPHV
jgi:hypothetical protein